MLLHETFVLLFCLVIQVWGIPRITLDDDAQSLCKKYKMMCKADKICAVQHFDWPKNITIPVCIPLSFVPVRKMICQLPQDSGRCAAPYVRWYFNTQEQRCKHFRYGGCEGNGNNFMSKRDCEQNCMATPSIRLYDDDDSPVFEQPSVITKPIYEPPKTRKYEALNSILEPSDDYDRYPITRHQTNRFRADEAITRTRRRLDKEKEKERKRRERRKEKRRLRKLQKKEQRKLRCKKRRERGKRCRKTKKSRKDRNKKNDNTVDDNAVSSENNDEVTVDTNKVVGETKDIINNEIKEAEDAEKLEKEAKREKRRQRRKLLEKRRLEKERNRRNLSNRHQQRYSESAKNSDSYSSKLLPMLDQDKNHGGKKSSLYHTLS